MNHSNDIIGGNGANQFKTEILVVCYLSEEDKFLTFEAVRVAHSD